MLRSGALAAILISLALAATASANSYCVAPATGCTNTATSVQDALTQAATHVGDDSISLGAATYAEDGLAYNPADHARVAIAGAGQDATTVRPATPSLSSTITLYGSGGPIDLSALTVVTGAGTGNQGVRLDYGGNLDRVQVLQGTGATTPEGVETRAAATITNSRFALVGNGSCVRASGTGDVILSDSTLLNCATGFVTQGPRAYAQRLHIGDVLIGIDVLSGTANLDDSLVLLRGSSSFAAGVSVSGSVSSTLYANQNTLIGTGSGTGVVAFNHAGSGTAQIDVYDSIIRGFTNPLVADSDGSGHPATLSADFNNYGGTTSMVGSGTLSTSHVSTDDPQFADGLGGDFHLQSTSPLIDLDPEPIVTMWNESATDLDGNVRIINAKRDYGAFERPLAPAAAAGPATDVTQTSAAIPGAGNGGGAAAASVKLVYGPTTSYGSEIALPALTASLADQAVSAALTGLSPSTTYHYALVVTNPIGSATSADQTFTTGSPPPPVCCAPPPVAKAALSALRISPSRFKAASKGATFARAKTGAKVTFTLSAAGTVKFTVLRAKRVKGRTRWVKVGRAMSRSGTSGANKLRFSGRVGGKKLKPGRYRLQSLDPSGATKRASFSIVRR